MFLLFFPGRFPFLPAFFASLNVTDKLLCLLPCQEGGREDKREKCEAEVVFPHISMGGRKKEKKWREVSLGHFLPEGGRILLLAGGGGQFSTDKKEEEGMETVPVEK